MSEEADHPLDIPWKLLSTTQTVKEGFPDDTTISIFSHEPRDNEVEINYPNERLIYLKFTISISPCKLEGEELEAESENPLVQDFISNQNLPVLHAIVDIAVTPEPFREGGFRPYFHSAAPVRRTMIETGVVGKFAFEGESNNVSFTKSASQVSESSKSLVDTVSTNISGGLPFGLIRGGISASETAVEGSRLSEQYQENLNRDASTERRELLSHTTNVENTLSLLQAKHIGSPFLRFSMSPPPLTNLSIDPVDPNLWYKQLLYRRSSGIEGVQDFFAVLVVPRNTNFCLQVLSRRFCVLSSGPILETPITEPSVSERIRLYAYLYKRYPQGTPLDYLDIDVSSQIRQDLPGNINLQVGDPHPVVRYWLLGEHSESYNVVYGWASHVNFDSDLYWALEFNGIINELPDEVYMEEIPNFFAYKTTYEVRRQMLLEDYYEQLATSPIEEDQILVNSLQLRTCIDSAGTSPETARIETSIEPSRLLSFKPRSFAIPQYTSQEDRSGARQIDHGSTINRWNTLQQEFISFASSQKSEDSMTLSFTEPQLVRSMLKHWSRFDKNDPNNHKLEDINHILKLTNKEIENLKRVNITTLKDLAEAILIAPKAEQLRDLVKSEQKNRHERSASQLAELENYLSTVKPKITYQDDKSITENRRKELIRNLEDRVKKIKQMLSVSQVTEEDIEVPITSTEAQHFVELIVKRLQEDTRGHGDAYQKEDT